MRISSIIIRMSVSERIIFNVVTAVIPRVYMCVPVGSFFPPRASSYIDPDIRVHRCTENSFIYYIIVIFAENATTSFACLECH